MISATFDLESKLWQQGYKLVCGVDEVGRGCFAGPVAAGVVIFPPNVTLDYVLADSKLLTPQKRRELDLLIRSQALCCSVAMIDVEIINKIGVGKAAQMAFKKAVESLKLPPDFVLIDAFLIEGIDKEKQRAIIHGDQISASISAASIIAKVYRDKWMEEIDSKYPGYGFAKHKGYGTREHQQAIAKFGLSDLHRTSFNLAKFVTPS